MNDAKEAPDVSLETDRLEQLLEVPAPAQPVVMIEYRNRGVPWWVRRVPRRAASASGRLVLPPFGCRTISGSSIRAPPISCRDGHSRTRLAPPTPTSTDPTGCHSRSEAQAPQPIVICGRGVRLRRTRKAAPPPVAA